MCDTTNRFLYENTNKNIKNKTNNQKIKDGEVHNLFVKFLTKLMVQSFLLLFCQEFRSSSLNLNEKFTELRIKWRNFVWLSQISMPHTLYVGAPFCGSGLCNNSVHQIVILHQNQSLFTSHFFTHDDEGCFHGWLISDRKWLAIVFIPRRKRDFSLNFLF